jgi:hypothetical protein
MPNMSYCRFQNTLTDLEDCYEAMTEQGDLSEDEERAKKLLINMCGNIHHDFGDE